MGVGKLDRIINTRSIWKMLGPFATVSRLTPIYQGSLVVLLHAACASMSTTSTTTTMCDRGDRYGPMEWAQWQNHIILQKFDYSKSLAWHCSYCICDSMGTGSVQGKWMALVALAHMPLFSHCSVTVWYKLPGYMFVEMELDVMIRENSMAITANLLFVNKKFSLFRVLNYLQQMYNGILASFV